MTDREMLEAVTQALGDLSFECFAVFDTTRPSKETYNRTFDVLEQARKHLKADDGVGEFDSGLGKGCKAQSNLKPDADGVDSTSKASDGGVSDA